MFRGLFKFGYGLEYYKEKRNPCRSAIHADLPSIRRFGRVQTSSLLDPATLLTECLMRMLRRWNSILYDKIWIPVTLQPLPSHVPGRLHHFDIDIKPFLKKWKLPKLYHAHTHLRNGNHTNGIKRISNCSETEISSLRNVFCFGRRQLVSFAPEKQLVSH